MLQKLHKNKEAEKICQLTVKTKPIQTLCVKELVQEHSILREKVLTETGKIRKSSALYSCLLFQTKKISIGGNSFSIVIFIRAACSQL